MRTLPSASLVLRRAALLLGAAFASLAFVETALWAAGVPLGYPAMADGYPLAGDLETRYRLRPGSYHQWDTDYAVNALGMRGPLPERPVVLSLGDSCTFGVKVGQREAFPFVLLPGRGEVADAGVPGWTTFNARRWLETSRSLDWHPRLVTIYFGWNDSNKALLTETAFYRARRWSGRSRLAALVQRLDQSLWRRDGPWAWSGLVSQVPLGDFEENIEAMAEEARAAGALPVLITPPYRPGWDGAQLADIERYAGAVRAVARRRGYALVDLAAEIGSMPRAGARGLFNDSAHLSARGHRLLADRLRPWLARAAAIEGRRE